MVSNPSKRQKFVSYGMLEDTILIAPRFMRNKDVKISQSYLSLEQYSPPVISLACCCWLPSRAMLFQ